MSAKVYEIFCKHFIKETVLPEYPPLQCTVLTAAPGRGRWVVGVGATKCGVGNILDREGRDSGGGGGRGDLATTFYWMVTFHQL